MYTRNTHHKVLMKVSKYRQLNMIINLLHVLNDFKVNKNWRLKVVYVYTGQYFCISLIFSSYVSPVFNEVGNVHSWKRNNKKIIIVGLELLVSTYCSILYFVFPWKLKKIKLYKTLSSIPSNKSTVLHYNQF